MSDQNHKLSSLVVPHVKSVAYWMHDSVLFTVQHFIPPDSFISTSPLTTCHNFTDATDVRILLPWPPQTHNKVSGYPQGEMWKNTGIPLYPMVTLNAPRYGARSGFKPQPERVHVDVNMDLCFPYALPKAENRHTLAAKIKTIASTGTVPDSGA